MQNVFPLELMEKNKALWGIGVKVSTEGSKPGLVEKILEPGKYVVLTQDGQRITAQGSRRLRVGNQVQVVRSVDLLNERGDDLINSAPLLKESRLDWKAFLPLGFGGKKAAALLRVYVEKNDGEFLGGKSPAIYFIFTIHTDKQGELQWSIYLKGHQVAVQVFSDVGEKKDGLIALVHAVENGLKERGFHLLAPTIYLKSPFRVPEGFRLNVKG